MSMTDTNPETKPATKQRKKHMKRAAKADKADKPFKAPDEFAGMTATECCIDCKPECCAISGNRFCAHPHKRAVDAMLSSDPKAMARYMQAKRALAHQKVDR